MAAATSALRENSGAFEMADVARRAGASPGLAYHHFGSKAGLLGAVISEFYDRYDMVANQKFPRGLRWAERERRRTDHVVRFLFDDPMAAIVLSRLSGAPEAAAVGATRLDALTAKGALNIATGQQTGELAAAFVLGGLRQTVAHALARSHPPSVSDVCEAAWRFIANTLELKELP